MATRPSRSSASASWPPPAAPWPASTTRRCPWRASRPRSSRSSPSTASTSSSGCCSPARQRDLLDAFGGHAAAAGRGRRRVGAWRANREALAALEMRPEELERRLALARHVVDEIAAVDPRPGEVDELRARLARAHRRGAVDPAGGGHPGQPGGRGDRRPGPGRARALHDARDLARTDPRLAPLVERLDGLEAEVVDIADELRRAADGLEADLGSVARLEERLGALYGLLRKYGETEEAVARAGGGDGRRGRPGWRASTRSARSARRRTAGCWPRRDEAAATLSARTATPRPDRSRSAVDGHPARPGVPGGGLRRRRRIRRARRIGRGRGHVPAGAQRRGAAAAAGPHRVRWRAVAGVPGHRAGAGGRRHHAHAGVRRGRRGHRWAVGRPGRSQPVAAGAPPPGAVRHPPAADRGARRRAPAHRQVGARRPDRHGHHGARRARTRVRGDRRDARRRQRARTRRASAARELLERARRRHACRCASA